MLKSLLKKLAFAAAPSRTTALLSARARAHSHRLVEEWGLVALNRKLIRVFGDRVQTGPFTGMILTPMTHKEHLGPYLLGTYEMELHPWLESLRGGYSQILDVGAKFGYYAVGLARRFPDSPVIAFDPDPWAQRALREMMAANGVASVAIVDLCTPGWLRANLRPNALIISDCEGYEGELFGEDVPALRSATLLIELHDMFVPGVGVAIRRRFEATHRCESLQSSTSRPAPPLDLGFLTESEKRSSYNEIRPEQEWLLLTPKES